MKIPSFRAGVAKIIPDKENIITHGNGILSKILSGTDSLARNYNCTDEPLK